MAPPDGDVTKWVVGVSTAPPADEETMKEVRRIAESNQRALDQMDLADTHRGAE